MRCASPSASPTVSPTEERATYEWADDITPADTYSVAFVQGISTRDALRALGQVRRTVGSLNAGEALDLATNLSNPHTYETPPIVQIGELDGGVIVYSPSGFRPVDRLAALSSHGVAAAFTTTVELDTSIDVATKGRRIREFDPFYYHDEQRGRVLPQEQGMKFTDADGFPPAWRFLDRMTGLHVGRDWFLETPHPTYVLTGRN